MRQMDCFFINKNDWIDVTNQFKKKVKKTQY